MYKVSPVLQLFPYLSFLGHSSQFSHAFRQHVSKIEKNMDYWAIIADIDCNPPKNVKQLLLVADY